MITEHRQGNEVSTEMGASGASAGPGYPLQSRSPLRGLRDFRFYLLRVMSPNHLGEITF
jgi:hypothetical protein